MFLTSRYFTWFSKPFPAGFLLFGLLLFGLSGTAGAADAPLPVMVSIAPQKYMLERIAGEHVSVSVLVKPGADPHSYEPSPAQMRSSTARKVSASGCSSARKLTIR